MGRNTVAVIMAAPLQYLLITVKVVALEKVSFSDEKQYLLNKDNLRKPIQIQLSQKQKPFCDFFFKFLKSISNFKFFAKEI